MEKRMPLQIDTLDTPLLILVNNDTPGIRCNHNIQTAARIANHYRIAMCILPRALAGKDAAAPAVYLAGETVTVHGDAHNGVLDEAMLRRVLEERGVPRLEKSGRLAEIEQAVVEFKRAIGEVPS